MMENLDLECAKLGHELAEIKADDKPVDEKLFTSALAVLEEQGPYACFLYLKAREGNAGTNITEKATSFLGRILREDKVSKDPLQFLQDLASDLDKLLFACDLLRLAFVYARYHAKTKEERRGGEET
jgi:hypothetical protein